MAPRQPNNGGKKKNNGKKPKQRQNKNRSVVVNVSRGMRGAESDRMLSRCAASFALAVCDPFNPKAVGVCLPIVPVLRSQKVARYLRGTFVVGTQGVGYVALAPSTSNDFGSVYTTSATYAQTGFLTRTSTTALATGVTIAAIPGPWTSNDLATTTSENHVGARLVCAGVNAQYIGPLLNQGGLISALVQPDHEAFTSSVLTPVDSFSAYRETYFRPNTGQRVTLSAVPVNNIEEAYSPISILIDAGLISNTSPIYPYGTNGVATFTTGSTLVYSDPIMGIFITGGVPGVAYAYEVVLHCEYTGRPVAAVSTMGESDIIGYQRVSAASQRLSEELGNSSSTLGASAYRVMDSLIANQAKLAHAATTVAGLAGVATRAFFQPRTRMLTNG